MTPSMGRESAEGHALLSQLFRKRPGASRLFDRISCLATKKEKMLTILKRSRDPVLTLCLPSACREVLLEAQRGGSSVSIFAKGEEEVVVIVDRPDGAPPAFIVCPTPPQ